jgi:hypothetical protein
MSRNQDPIVFTQDNEDGTREVVAGDFSPFNIIVISNAGTSVVPAERDHYGFYSYGDTLPGDADVRVTR